MQKEIDTRLEFAIEDAIRDFFESDRMIADYEVTTPDGTKWIMIEDSETDYISSEIKDTIMEVLLND